MRQNLILLAIKRRLWLVYEGGNFTFRGVRLINGARLSSDNANSISLFPFTIVNNQKR